MADTHSNPKRAASEMVEQLKNSGALDELFVRIDSGEVELTGDGGLVPVLIKETLERGLQAELTSHLGYEPGDREAKTTSNARNGSYTKTVASEVGDAVLDAVMEWQHRPLEEFYPVMYLDAIRVKVRDHGQVRSKAAHIAIGVDMDGIKHVLGMRVQSTEGASFWAHVCAELANRGVKDVLIVCCDGLTGLPEAIEATWPDSLVQTCVVHLIRAANRFVAYQDRKAVSKALKTICTAASEDQALEALTQFADSPLGQKYPSAVATWKRAWEQFVPFLGSRPRFDG